MENPIEFTDGENVRLAFANIADEMGAYSDMLSRGIGFWLMILSSAGLLASPFVEKYIPKKEETENNFM